MKKLVFAIAALAALSLLAPTSGFAQLDLTANNQIGIYADTDATAAYVEGVDNLTSVTGYLIVTNPYNEAEGEAAAALGGFEVALNVPASCVLTGAAFPNDTALNVGDADNMIVGLGTPSQVINNMVHLATLTFLYVGGGAPAEITLAPTEPASIEGVMDVVIGSDRIEPCYPSSGNFASPVFGINTTDIVATEMSSFDNVKAMYR